MIHINMFEYNASSCYSNKGAFTLTLSEHPCPSQYPSPWPSFVYTTSEARIRGYPRPWPFLVACSSDHVHGRLWACALHNLEWTPTSVSEEIATCSDELGHGRPRQKSRTRTRISVNTKHQFTCFDCVRARTRILGPRSRMQCKCAFRRANNSVDYIACLEFMFRLFLIKCIHGYVSEAPKRFKWNI